MDGGWRRERAEGARRQRRLETAPPSSVNGPPVTVFQIQCTRQIETDTVQTSGSCIFSDTVQSSGLGPCASLAPKAPFAHYSRSPKNPALQQLQKSSKSASTTPQRPIWNSFATVGVRDFWENGCMFKFCGRRYGLVTAGLHAAIWSKKEEHTACLGQTRPKHHFFRESRFWCFEGSWERKRRSLWCFSKICHVRGRERLTIPQHPL